MNKISMHPLEVLATGQQFVAYGTHPETGKDYTWPVQAPDDTLVSSIPVVTEEQVRAAIQEAYDALPAVIKPARLPANDGPVILGGGSGETAQATIEAITEALNWIPNGDLSWDDWKRVLMAVFVSSCGSEPAYFEFLKWSRKSKKNTDITTRREWTSCRASPPTRIGFGTLHFLATQNGWAPSSDLYFTQEKREAHLTDVSGFEDIKLPPAKFESNNMPFTTTQTTRVLTNPNLLNGNDRTRQLTLTQHEIGRATLPSNLLNEFPEEWLYTNSLIGRIAQWIDSSCQYQQRLYSLMAALTVFAAIVGRQYHTESGLRPSLCVCIIGKTGSGKEAPRKAATELLRKIGADNLLAPMGGFSSGSGLIENLEHRPSKWLAIDEFGKKIAAYSAKGDQNQREMIAMLLEAIANDFISGKGYANSRENRTRFVHQPNLNIYGVSQIEEITGALSSAASSDGFVQRFLFVPTFAEYVPMRRGFKLPPVPELLVDELKALIQMLNALGGVMATNDDPHSEPNSITVQITPQAQEIIYQLDMRRSEFLQAARPLWVRSLAHTIKIAMLEAIASSPNEPVITPEGLESARKLVDWLTNYGEIYILPRIADNETERSLNKVRQIINDAGPDGISLRQLTRKTQSLGSYQLREALFSLLNAGTIDECKDESKKGRPPTIYRMAA